MPMLVAPIAGMLSDRIGSRPLMATGLALQAVAIGWLGRRRARPTTPYVELIVPVRRSPAPAWRSSSRRARTRCSSSVRPTEAGQASGATNAIREVGGVMGVAVLAGVFAANGGYARPQAFTDGVIAALPIAAAVLAVGAVIALLVPGKARARTPATAPAAEPVPA